MTRNEMRIAGIWAARLHQQTNATQRLINSSVAVPTAQILHNQMMIMETLRFMLFTPDLSE